MDLPKTSQILMIVAAVSGCGTDESGSDPVSPRSAPAALTVESLSNATYENVIEGRLTLTDGLFEGEPFEEDAASRPIVKLVPGAVATGDLNGDGSEEAVVVLAHNSGGSGVFMYLAVMHENGGKPDNLATIRLGDRVKVIAVDIDEGEVVAELVEHGPDDPMCCPTRKIRREWHFRDGQLFPLGQEIEPEGGRFRGHLVWGHESRSFTECGGDEESWVINESGEELIEVYEELTSTPYQPMFVEVRGEWVDPPTDGFGAEYAEALRITDLVRAENEGFGCRLDLEDVLFVASGNEPSWRLQIREDGISMRSMDVPGESVFSAPRTQAKASRVVFEAEGPESVITVRLERRRCIDTMSGARYAWAAAIDIDGRHLEGCAAEGL
jgi:uncharacterized membrane protein